MEQKIGDRPKKAVEKKITKADMSRIMNTIMDSVEEARDCGQDEYARDKDNAFANFERIADWMGKSKEEILMVYLLKHIDGIISWVDGNESQREDVTGRITDAVTYLCLLWGMVESKRL
jgi:hypothetical protein